MLRFALAFITCNQKKQLECMKVSELLNKPICGKKRFTVKNKCIFFKEWVNSQIVYVKDLINKNGSPKTDKDLFLKNCKLNKYCFTVVYN